MMSVPERESITVDVLIVGAGPSGLATAIHLADLVNHHNQMVDSGQSRENKLPLSILVLEKGGAVGSHTLSGAVINPLGLKELLPGMSEKDMPFESPVVKDEFWYLTSNLAFKNPIHPPYMSNHGNYVASLGRVVQWLAGIAEQKGVQVFPGFSGREIMYDGEQVAGVRTGDTGVDKHGHPMDNYQAGSDVRAKITVIAEGPRGFLAGQLIEKLGLASGRNPQVYSTGVKEVWQVPSGTFETGRIAHTMGYPLNLQQFGGGFIYGMTNDQVALGLVIALDYLDPTVDLHHAFQVYKQHPFISKILEKGKLLRYGAKTLPEGGLFSLPKLYGDGVMLAGDSAGFLSMPSLKGIHLAIQSGMLAAQTAFEALKKNDFSAIQLAQYETRFKQSSAYRDLFRVRNFRQSFNNNMPLGAIHFGAQLFTGGHGLSFSGHYHIDEDSKHCKPLSALHGGGFLKQFAQKLEFDKKLTFDKATDVFYSGSQHDEEQPCHCTVPNPAICDLCIEKYGAPCQHFCPAEVYELYTDSKTGKKEIRIHPANCVHCKTCDIKDPLNNLKWTPPYGGDGPQYENM